MPAYDQCHPQVVRALEREGWRSAPKPQPLVAGQRPLFIDIKASRNDISIFVEVKCFTDGKGVVEELYGAIGQYLIYRSLLHQNDLLGSLYLTVSNMAYEGILHRLALATVREIGMKLIVLDLENEVVERWLE